MRYRHHSWKEFSRQIRLIAYAGSGFFLAGFAIDWLLFEGDPRVWTLGAVRVGVAAAILIVGLLLNRCSDRIALADGVVLTAILIVSAATCVIIALSPGQVVIHLVTALVVILVYYLFAPIPAVAVCAASLAFSAGFVASVYPRLLQRPNEVASVILYLMLANVLGMGSSRLLHQVRRREYATLEATWAAHEEIVKQEDWRQQAERALIESEERYRSLVELAPDAILVHQRGEIVYLNPTGFRLVGAKSDEDVLGRSVFDFVMPEYRDLARERMETIYRDRQVQPPVEMAVRCIDGRVAYCEVVAGLIPYGGELSVQAVIRDAGDRHRLEEELTRLATTDPLTGVCNRRHFFDRFEEEWERARRHDRMLSVLMLDIDHFKRVNDLFGHAVGDEVLKAIVNECRTATRKGDVVGRLGGEEFAVLLAEVGGDEAAVAAENLRSHVADTPIETPDGTLILTVSIGSTECLLHEETPDDALKRADDALYEAKRRGRNQVCSADPAMDASPAGT